MKIFRILVLFLVGLAAMLKAEDSCRFPVLDKESWEESVKTLVDNINLSPKMEDPSSVFLSEIQNDSEEVVGNVLSFSSILEQIYLYENDRNRDKCYLGICGELREAADCNGGKCTGEGFDKSGKRYEAHCVNGKYNGKQILYNNKKAIMELNYVNGILDGKQKLPNIVNGENIIINDVIIKNGKLNGKLNLGDTSSKPFINLNVEIKNGKMSGYALRASFYDYGGTALPMGYEEIKFDDKGNLVRFYKNYDDMVGNKESLTKYNNGKMVSYKYVWGLENGVKIFALNITDDEIDKKLKEISKVRYYSSEQYNEQGQKQGKWIKQENNDIIESNYANDKLNGVKKEWKNGKLIKEETYANDELNGDVKEYDENGELIKHEIYKNNKRTKILK